MVFNWFTSFIKFVMMLTEMIFNAYGWKGNITDRNVDRIDNGMEVD